MKWDFVKLIFFEISKKSKCVSSSSYLMHYYFNEYIKLEREIKKTFVKCYYFQLSYYTDYVL